MNYKKGGANEPVCYCPVLFFLYVVGWMRNSSSPPRQVFEISNIRITCDSAENITRDFYLLRPGYGSGAMIYGYYRKFDGIHVMWSGKRDINGEPIPDLEALGEEVWHSIKGFYHGEE
jgi:hypothetical protein